MQIKQKSLKKNAILNLIKSIMGIIFPLITFPYSSRILLPEGIGKVNFANSIVSYFAMIAALGINTYATREAAKLRDNKIELTKFFKEVFLINLISTFIAYLLFFAAVFFIPKFSEYRVLLCVCSVSILMNTMGIGWLFTAEEEFGYITARSIVFQFISLGLLFAFVKTKDDFIWYASINVISSAGSNICNLFYSRKFINWKQKTKYNLLHHIKPIMIFFGMSIVSSVYTMLDTSMLGFLSSNVEVGYYTAATKLNKIVLVALVAIIGVLLPRLSYYAEKKDFSQLKELFNKAFNCIIVLSIPAAVGLFLLSKDLTLLLSGKEYLPAVPSMRIINPILIFISLSNLIGIQLFTPIGKEKITLFSVIIGAVINLVFNSIFIPLYGAKGAAIGTVIAEFSVTLVQLIIARHYIFIKNQLKNLVQSLIASFIMAVLLVFVLKLNLLSLYKVIISIFSGVCIYGLILWLLHNEVFFYMLLFLKSKVRKEKR